jgi:hypothetical protein
MRHFLKRPQFSFNLLPINLADEQLVIRRPPSDWPLTANRDDV